MTTWHGNESSYHTAINYANTLQCVTSRRNESLHHTTMSNAITLQYVIRVSWCMTSSIRDMLRAHETRLVYTWYYFIHTSHYFIHTWYYFIHSCNSFLHTWCYVTHKWHDFIHTWHVACTWNTTHLYVSIYMCSAYICVLHIYMCSAHIYVFYVYIAHTWKHGSFTCVHIYVFCTYICVLHIYMYTLCAHENTARLRMRHDYIKSY